MGKSNNKTDKKAASSNKKDKAKKSETVTLGRDPARVRVVFGFFIFFMILTFAVGAFSIVLLTGASHHNGIISLAGKSFSMIQEYDSGMDTKKGAAFDANVKITPKSTIGFVRVNKGKICVNTGEYVGISSSDPNKVDVKVKIRDGKKFITQTRQIAKSSVIGVKTADVTNEFILSVATNPNIYIIVFAAFVAVTFVIGLLYYLVSPRGAKQYEKTKKGGEEKQVVQMVTTVNSENSELLSHYLSTDDNIQPIDAGQNETSALLNINYYSSVRLHNGEVYTVVKKYQETVRRLEEYGASDMDLIKMNMIGNSEFDELILNTHKERTMTMWEIIDFTRKLDGVYCIKKRGILNWTFKYKSKTLLILKRDDNDSDSYKVSIKVYPDAATKLNIIYKALEDSSFPIGPYWYMFNDLRNLPANVIKWLITESLNISKWQQIKADLLRETPTLESYKLDVNYMRDMIIANTRELDMGKFTLITQADTTDEVKYDTVLETGFDDMDMEQFTKEITMVVPTLNNVQMSILTRKNASEALVNSLCNELLDFSTPTQQAIPENPNDLNQIAAPVATKVMKKAKKK